MSLLIILQDGIADIFNLSIHFMSFLIVLIFNGIYGLYIIYKSKKTNARMLLPLGMLIFLIGVQNLPNFIMDSATLFLLPPLSRSFLYFSQVYWIIIPFCIIILGFYLSINLLLSEQRRAKILADIILFTAAIEITSLLVWINSGLVGSTHEIFLYYDFMFISNESLIFVSLSLLGFGFLYKCINKKGLLRRKFLFLSAGFLLFSIFQCIKWISIFINWFFGNIISYWENLVGFISLTTIFSSILSYLGLKEERPLRQEILIEEGLFRIYTIKPDEIPEESDEVPILLLIVDESGTPYFSHSFMPNWDYSDLLGSFMSALNAFSDNLFSESISRIRIGENIILINPVDPYLVCYVIKGKSRLAFKKLKSFSDTIKEKSEIWESLHRSTLTSTMLDLNNPPSLGVAVNEIFNT